jgi:uncharacterized protein (DUF1697 family)
MKTYIALLRGINVGGHRKIPMADLRDMLTKIGFKNVKTYIQSGNVCLQSDERNPLAMEQLIKKAIKDKFDFDVPVLVRTKEQLNTIFNRCPFPKDEKEKSYFAILNASPTEEYIAEASKKTYENEYYQIIDDCLYFYCANGYGRAKFSLALFEKKLAVQATARNYKTMLKLISLATESEANHQNFSIFTADFKKS